MTNRNRWLRVLPVLLVLTGLTGCGLRRCASKNNSVSNAPCCPPTVAMAPPPALAAPCPTCP